MADGLLWTLCSYAGFFQLAEMWSQHGQAVSVNIRFLSVFGMESVVNYFATQTTPP